jgi:hypothetical protein
VSGNDDLSKVLMLLGRKVIGFHPVYAQLAQSASAGLMLSQMMHLTQREDVRKVGGWFFHTYKQWEEETCMQRRELDGARKRLKALTWDGVPLLEEDRRGQPARNYYRLNLPVLAELLLALKNGGIEQTDQIVQNGESSLSDGDQSGLALAYAQEWRARADIESNVEIIGEKNREKTTRSADADTAGDPAQDPRPTPGPRLLPDPDPVPDPVPEPPPAPPRERQTGCTNSPVEAKERTYTQDQLAFELAHAYYGAMGVERKAVPKANLMRTKNTLKQVAEAYDEEDVRGVVGYLRSDPWWREPGRLTPGKVVDILPEWVAQGRPEARVPNERASGDRHDGFVGTGKFARLVKEMRAHEAQKRGNRNDS